MGFGPMRQKCKVLHEPPDRGRHFFFRTPDARSLEGDTRMNSPQDDAASNPTSNAGVLFNNVGTLYTFCPLTLRAKEWIDEHVQDDAQWFGYMCAVLCYIASTVLNVSCPVYFPVVLCHSH